jgi:hypothetical protein
MQHNTSSSKFNRDLLPPPRTFYEREGYSIGKSNSSGWAMCKGQPPCHKSKSGKSFSINVNHGGFYCHGCGAKGDIFAYVMMRDGCNFVTAAKVLGCWNENLTPQERVDIVRRHQERGWYRQQEANMNEWWRIERIKRRNDVHLAFNLYRECEQELHLAGPYAESEWEPMPAAFDGCLATESDYCAVAGLESPYEF